MLLKNADNKDYQIKELESLLSSATGDRKSRIEQELRIVRAGIKGEHDAAYLIDFDFKNLDFYAVIHDLRLEVGGRVAQIDHLVISRCLDCFVLETKYLRGGMKITEDGEFLRWNDYKKTFEGMASPLAQNDRHIAVLREAFGLIDMPTRLGLRLQPTFHSYVLVSPEARIDRPEKFDTSRVIKADVFKKTVLDKYDKESFLGTVGSMAKVISAQTLEQLARQVVTLHKPIRINVAAKFGAPEPVKAGRTTGPLPARSPEQAARPNVDAPACKDCRGGKGSIQYGKFGYYFKCNGCGANTSAKVNCGQSGHKARIRKEGQKFFFECEDCKSSTLYFTNP
jgi:hypothetical protein